jgi:hypothetical protein
MTVPAEPSIDAAKAPGKGMSARAALRLEYAIIGLGVFALALIFQPFSLTLFGVGCALVVLAGLTNNLLPLCEAGVPLRSVVIAGLVVADIFCAMLLIAIAAAHLYGVYFVTATAPDTSDPFYRQPFVWGIAILALLIGAAISMLRARRRAEA